MRSMGFSNNDLVIRLSDRKVWLDFLNSELNSIDGIGEKTALSLMRKFKSVNSIKTKSIKELNSVVGQNKARIIYNYFNN